MHYSKSSLSAIESITNKMHKMGVASHADLIGVPEREIQKFENKLGRALPEIYRLYLATFGRSAGFLSPWLAFYFDDLSEIEQQFKTCNARANPPVELPSTILLIANCEDIFDGIDLAEENPKVLRWDFATKRKNLGSTAAEDLESYFQALIKNSDSLTIPDDFLSDDEAIYKEDLINF